MRWRIAELRRRLRDAVEVLRTGRLETGDDLDRINQAIWEMGFDDRDDAREFVSDKLVELWESTYPSDYCYPDGEAPASHHGPWCDEESQPTCRNCWNLAEDARVEEALSWMTAARRITIDESP